MRVHDDRYNRERRRFEVALHFIRYEARTRTIRAWTGLSDDRIRKLYRTYIRDARHAPQQALPVRHRGKSPRQAAYFTRSVRIRQESALLASLCRLIGALPASRAAESTHDPAGLARGEFLCQAYESYRSLVGAPLISFEHAVFLLGALWRGDELALASCPDCGAVLVADRWSIRSPKCGVCGPATRSPDRCQRPVS